MLPRPDPVVQREPTDEVARNRKQHPDDVRRAPALRAAQPQVRHQEEIQEENGSGEHPAQRADGDRLGADDRPVLSQGENAGSRIDLIRPLSAVPPQVDGVRFP